MSADKKYIRTACAIIGLFAICLFCTCKKSPTVPKIDDTSRPVIWMNQYELSFAATESGGNPAIQTIKIKNAGPGTLDYTISPDAAWVSVSPAAGTSSGQATEHKVSVNKSVLEVKETNYKATLTIECSQAYNNPQHVEVNLNITKETPPKIWIDNQNFTFNAQEGGANPSAQNIKIKNDGPGTLNYELNTDAPWLGVNPVSGSTQEDLMKVHQIHVDVSNLASGTRTGKITVKDSNAANSPQTIDVTLIVNKTTPPKIWLSTNALAFTAIQGGADPVPKTFTVMNGASGVLKYAVDWAANWLLVSPDSGESGGAERNHTVSVNTGGLGTGSYQDTIEISDSHASNTPQKVNITLTVTTPPTDNSISISSNPSSAKTNSIVSFPVTIKGNLNEISVFGLDLTFDASIFEFHSINKGSLTGGWVAVDGNEINAGTVKVGGFAGSANPIPVASIGTIVFVKLKVISTSSSNRETKVWIKNYIDHIQGMNPSSTSATFTYLK